MATPPRRTARDFDPRVLRLFDQYVHGTRTLALFERALVA